MADSAKFKQNRRQLRIHFVHFNDDVLNVFDKLSSEPNQKQKLFIYNDNFEHYRNKDDVFPIIANPDNHDRRVARYAKKHHIRSSRKDTNAYINNYSVHINALCIPIGWKYGDHDSDKVNTNRINFLRD